jgi:acid phosphatase family membrane protein YuiD
VCVKARLFAAVFKNTYFAFDLLFIFNIIIDSCGVRGKGGEAVGKLVDNFEHAKKLSNSLPMASPPLSAS